MKIRKFMTREKKTFKKKKNLKLTMPGKNDFVYYKSNEIRT